MELNMELSAGCGIVSENDTVDRNSSDECA